jgi:hypothetical protein
MSPHFHLDFRKIFALAVIVFMMSILSLIGGCAANTKTALPGGGVQDAAVRAEARKQKEAAFATYIKRQEHVYRIAFPLLAEAAVLNPDDAEPTCGFLIHSIQFYKEDFREAAAGYYNLDKQIAVRYVHPQFPAASAGLCTGDKIMSINGKQLVGATQDDVKKTAGELKPIDGKPLVLSINRNGEVIQMSIEGKSYCDYPVLLLMSDKINAFSDGKYIVVTTGIYRMTQTDEELALVLSHEIAHNLMKHRKQRAEKAAPGTILDFAIAFTLGINTHGTFGDIVSASYSKDFEREADYVGLYLAARAGYDISESANFWRRMSIENPSSIEKSYSNTHPSNPERFLAIERTVNEINEKKRLGMPLVPNVKPKASPKTPASQNIESSADRGMR